MMRHISRGGDPRVCGGNQNLHAVMVTGTSSRETSQLLSPSKGEASSWYVFGDSTVFSGTLRWIHCLHLEQTSASWRKLWLLAQGSWDWANPGHIWLSNVLVPLCLCVFRNKFLAAMHFSLELSSPLSPPVP